MLYFNNDGDVFLNVVVHANVLTLGLCSLFQHMHRQTNTHTHIHTYIIVKELTFQNMENISVTIYDKKIDDTTELLLLAGR
jgi:hypothetical protein